MPEDPTTGEWLCPTCGQRAPHADPLYRMAAANDREAAFLAAYPRIHCPSCRKRVSPAYDNIDAQDFNAAATPTVRMTCPHCAHRWELPRPERTPSSA